MNQPINDNDTIMRVDANSMKGYFRSKFDIYVYLKEMKQLYLPSYEDTRLRKPFLFLNHF